MTRPTPLTAQTHLQAVHARLGYPWLLVKEPHDWHLVHADEPRLRLYIEGKAATGFELALRADLPWTMWDEDRFQKWPYRPNKALPVAFTKAVAHYLQVLPR